MPLPTPTLHTERLRLRPFAPSDADAIYALQSNARVLQKLGFKHEGTQREDCIVDGVVSDSWVLGLLRRAWQRGAAGGP